MRTYPVEELLTRALKAQTPRGRALWARRGLALGGSLDPTMQAMLLRQLYLAHFEERRFDRARKVAEQALSLDVLVDVVRQDAARACQAAGDIAAAAAHLRLAARCAPPNRRAFHWWTLGGLFYLAGRYDEAVSVLDRAVRWGTKDKPLFEGHRALARCARGDAVGGLSGLVEQLNEVPAGQGYGRFVLGMLAFYDHRWDDARRYLEAFVARTSAGRPALAIALEGELAVARRTLAQADASELS
jgi:tetratricopeptide (TPR) repeat protein